MNLKNKKVLVFGGAGFIGSHLTERLIQEGAAVTVYDNLKTGRTANLAKVWRHPGFRFIEADVCERNKVEEAVPGHEVIFHFCDDSDIRSAAEHPDTFVEQNIMGLFYVLESMRRNGIRLLEDDSLINHLSVTTDLLLGAHDKHHVRIVITVTMWPIRAMMHNVGVF